MDVSDLVNKCDTAFGDIHFPHLLLEAWGQGQVTAQATPLMEDKYNYGPDDSRGWGWGDISLTLGLKCSDGMGSTEEADGFR